MLAIIRKQGIQMGMGPVVTIDEEAISCERADGLVERVTWAELRAVIIETNDQAPWLDDVFWILVGRENGCVIPQGVEGEGQLLERLQELDGFDNEAVIAAMQSTDNQRFLCWKRP